MSCFQYKQINSSSNNCELYEINSTIIQIIARQEDITNIKRYELL